MSGTLFVVATPIGNLEDITARALRVLREVSLIAAEDTRRTAHLLTRYGITTPATSLHEHNEGKKAQALLVRLRGGESIALVSDAGTPTVSDPGQHLIAAAIAENIRVEPIPGPSAALAALAVSGLPAATFTFLGFPPIRSKDRNWWFDRLALVGGTVIFFEAPHRIVSTLKELMSRVGDCKVSIGRELTKIHEELVRGPISTVLNRLGEPKGEFTVVADIGQMTAEMSSALPEGPELLDEFGRMSNKTSLGRRAAIAALARKYQCRASLVYDAIERAKKLAQS